MAEVNENQDFVVCIYCDKIHEFNKVKFNDETKKFKCPFCDRYSSFNKYQHIQYVSHEKVLNIIENRSPKGLFYITEGKLFTAIDNTTGDAWTESFDTLDLCSKYLIGEVDSEGKPC